MVEILMAELWFLLLGFPVDSHKWATMPLQLIETQGLFQVTGKFDVNIQLNDLVNILHWRYFECVRRMLFLDIYSCGTCGWKVASLTEVIKHDHAD